MSDPTLETGEAGPELRGRLLVLLSGAGMSLSGLFIRSIEAADEWQILFYRSIGIVAALLVFIAIRNRGAVWPAFRKAGWNGVLAGLCLAFGFICFIFSITHTTVANTLFLLAAAPFITAVLGRVVLGERVRRATWIAMAMAVTGVAIMVSDGLAGGGLFGDLTALGAATALAGFSVALRRGRGVDMLPAVCHAGVFTWIAAGAMSLIGGGLAVTGPDLAVCLVYGMVAISVSLMLFTMGSRWVPAAELTLLSLSEVVLGPLWVWLVFAETPSGLTLAGGGVLLVAITGHALGGMRRRRPPIGVI